MATPAPADFQQYQGRKNMSEDNQAVEEYKRNCEYHRLLRKYCGPNAYSVFTALVDRANDKEYDGWAFPSYELLMEDTGMGNRNAITTALEILFDLGLIEWQLNGRHALYKPVKKMNSTELILFNRRAEQYQNDTKDSIKSIPSIVSKRYSNVYQSNVNQINELTTPNGVAAPPSKTIDFTDNGFYQEKEPEPQPEETIPDALLPDKSEATTQPGPATDKGRARVKASSVHIPAAPQLDQGQEVKGFEAGGGERDMHAKSKANPKSKPRDERLDNPAVILYRQNCKLTPNEVQRDMIITQVTDLGEWEKNLKYWMGAGYKPGSVDKIVDCYKNQNYVKGGHNGPGGNGKQGFGTDRVRSAQGPGSNGRFLGKFSAFGPSGRLTDKQLEDAW
jgi:hypothetical protein